MQLPVWYYFTAALLATLWASIFVRGIRFGLVREYPVIYWFVGVSAFCYGLKWLGSRILPPYPDYFLVYIFASFPPVLLALAVLIRMYSLGKKPMRIAALVVPLLVSVLIFMDTPVQEEYQVYFRLTSALFSYVAIFGLFVLFRLGLSRDLAGGRTWLLILGGVMFPYAVASLNHLAYFAEIFSMNVFAHAGEPILVVSWIVIWRGLRGFNLPKSSRA